MPRTFICLVVLAALSVPARAAGEKKAIDRTAVAQSVLEGDLLLGTNKLNAAMKAFEKADKLSHHTCVTCYLGMLEIKKRMGDLSGARGEADRALKAAGANKVLVAQVLLARGVIYAAMANGAKDKKLKKAGADFRQELKLEPTLIVGHFDLGVVLLREKRDQEGIAELKSYLTAGGAGGTTVAEARSFIANPDRAREPYIPNFSITTVEGHTITNTALAGKVVLLDFWATWCPPCRDSVPMIADLHKKYAGRPVEIIGISSDTDPGKWKAFVAKHHMDWPETIDLSGQMQRKFRINEFPTYFVVDGNGAIRFRTAGYGADSESEIETAINKALKDASKKQSTHR